MRLLITNDDGINAPGIQTLARHVSRWIRDAHDGDVRSAVVLAPNRNFSGMSSAVGDVFESPAVPYERIVIEGAENIPAYALDAPPALCTIIGSIGSFVTRPDIVLSGINAGANVGRSVLHSGTIGAILTGAQLGLSGLAVSVQYGDEVHYDTAAAVAVEVLDEFEHAPERTLLNLNVPNLTAAQLKGVRRGRISNAGIIKGAGQIDEGFEHPPVGTIPLRFGAATPQLGDVSDEEADDDGALVMAGYASLTALRGVQEEADVTIDEIVRSALRRIDAHLAARR